jgi:hypothetical protein
MYVLEQLYALSMRGRTCFDLNGSKGRRRIARIEQLAWRVRK